MKKIVYLTFLILSKYCVAQIPGSGYALQFSGLNDVVRVSHASNIAIGTNFSIEAWVYITAYPLTLNENIIASKGLNINGFRLSVYDNDGTKQILFSGRQNIFPFTSFTRLAPAPPLNKWIHIAATKDATTANLYIDGILQTSGYGTQSITVNDDGNDLTIGNYGNAAIPDFKGFKGIIDEFKYWTTTLSETEIRTSICSKISNTHPLINDLKLYYQFDNTTGTVSNNSALYSGLNGLLQGGGGQPPAWVVSGAPIGDFSSSSYNPADNYYISVANPVRGDKFNATLTTAISTAKGIHVYGINNYPNTLSGTLGVGSNNGYWGVFVAGNNGATYDAGYSFQNLEPMLPSNLNDLRLYKRTNNAATNWIDASAVFSGTTCTAYGQNTEYILGSVGSVLPLQLVSFTGIAKGNTNLLQWVIDNNIAVSKFDIQKSTDGFKFVTLGQIQISNNQKAYEYNDVLLSNAGNNNFYYRLKIIDTGGSLNYSKIIVLNNNKVTQATLQPTVSNAGFTLVINKTNVLNTQALLFNANNQLVKSFIIKYSVTSIDATMLASGLYFIKLSNGETLRFVKK